jgi:site-specific DNA recombinase
MPARVVDLGTLAERYFAPGKAALLSIGEQIDTRGAAGRLVLNVLASVSQWEREAIGERTATAMQHKGAAGRVHRRQAPYGRRVTPDGARLEPDAQEVAARAVARQLRAQGLSLRGVAAELERRGVRSREPRGGGVSGRLTFTRSPQRAGVRRAHYAIWTPSWTKLRQRDCDFRDSVLP